MCKALDLTQPSKVKVRLNEKGVNTIPTLTTGGTQNLLYVNESNLYKTIFQSRKESAEKFTDWVTSEVLPAIRKNGGCIAGQEDLSDEELLSKALIVAGNKIAERDERIKALQRDNSALAADNMIMRPKAEYFDELVDRNLLTSFRETAKLLGVPEKKFIGFLLDKKYLYRDKRGKLAPYADKNSGLFELKESFNEKTQWSGTQTLVTPRGRETFKLLCCF